MACNRPTGTKRWVRLTLQNGVISHNQHFIGTAREGTTHTTGSQGEGHSSVSFTGTARRAQHTPPGHRGEAHNSVPARSRAPDAHPGPVSFTGTARRARHTPPGHRGKFHYNDTNTTGLGRLVSQLVPVSDRPRSGDRGSRPSRSVGRRAGPRASFHTPTHTVKMSAVGWSAGRPLDRRA